MEESSYARLPKLTRQESKVLALRAQGKSIAEIGEILVIEDSTVKFHLTNIYDKLGVRHIRSSADRLLKIQQYYQALDKTEDNIVVEPEQTNEPENSQEFFTPAFLLVLEDEIELLKKESAPIQVAITPIPSIDKQFNERLRRYNRRIAFMIILIALVVGVAIDRLIAGLWELQDNGPVATVDPIPILPNITTTLPINDPVASIRISLCGETNPIDYSVAPRFLRSQGVTIFNVENTSGAVLGNFVRAITIDQRGVWIGYFHLGESRLGEIGLYTKQEWLHCAYTTKLVNQNINDIKINAENKIWLATEKLGVFEFDGTKWDNYTTEDGLPSNMTYSLTIDDKGIVWVATSEGVASFDGKVWKVPYAATNNTLFHNKVHVIAFDHAGNIWVGHIHDGISQYDNSLGKWFYHTSPNGPGGNQIRNIVVRQTDSTHPESVWFATDDGGVSKFEQGVWTVYQVQDGLPSNQVTGLAIDKYNRVWIATSEGVAYFEGESWKPYNSIDTLSVALSPDCQECPFEEGEHLWTGTAKMGLTHSRLPYFQNEDVVKVEKICFELVAKKERNCVPLVENEFNGLSMISASYPKTLTPGDKLRFEITVVPHTPYQLREDRGDFLSNIDENDENLLGVWPLISVKGTADPGQPYTFINYDTVLTAPQFTDGEQEEVFTSMWRVWMHTRYIGPIIQMKFTVRKNNG